MVIDANWVTAIGTLATGAGAGLGGWAAVRGVNAWRAETVGRRKAELAEEVLAQFYRAKDALTWARLPSGEGAAQSPGADGVEGGGRGAEAMAAPIERLNQASQVFSELQASRYRFMAYFGEDAAKPFEDLRKVHNEVMEAAAQLIRGQDKAASAENDADRRHWRTTIGWGPHEQDRLAERLEHAVRAIERICRPLIEEPRPRALHLTHRRHTHAE
jgi:hypothetical protein